MRYIQQNYKCKCKMYINFIILLITLIINQNTNSQSYFFTQEESDAILENLNKPKRKIKKKHIKKKMEYKLSGICYSEPNKWTVWINDEPYNKIGQYQHFSIDEVSPDRVTITTNDCKTIHLSVTCDDNKSKNIKSIDNKTERIKAR